MPELGGAPWRGLAKIARVDATGTRTWAVGIGITTHNASGDQAGWESTGGGTLTLTYQEGTSGLTPPGAANTVTIEMRLPDGSQVGTTDWTNPTDGDTQTIRFDTDPIANSPSNDEREGMLEIYMNVVRTDLGSYDLDSRGNGADGNDEFAQGYVRSNIVLDSDTLSNVSLGGAEPSQWAYPDDIFAQSAHDTLYESNTLELAIVSSGGSDIRTKTASGTAGARNYTLQDNEGIDDDFSNALYDLELRTTAADFGGDNKYVFNATGHATGWAQQSELVIVDADRMDVDPSVSVQNFTLDNVATTVFNRGQSQGGEFEVINARSEIFTPRGNERVRTWDIGTAAAEDTATDSRVSGTISWDATFATSGNVAPLDATGSQKAVIWDDVNAGTNSPTVVTSAIGFLSSLYDLAEHLQNDDNALDPSLNTTQRLTSELGFYSVKITDQQGQAVNGATGDLTLQDDASLVSAIVTAGLTTAAQNGNDGYTPLQAWSSQLPSGIWDLWASTQFTKDGNTTNDSRQGAGNGEFTIVAQKPNFSLVVGAGPVTPNEGDHAHPAEAIIIGMALFDTTADVIVTPTANTAFAVVTRLNQATGEAEYLDLAFAWQSLAGAAVADEHQLAASAGDSRVYTLTLSAANTASFDHKDLFVIGRMEQGGTPYTNVNQITVVDTQTVHDGSSATFDAVAFVTGGEISFK